MRHVLFGLLILLAPAARAGEVLTLDDCLAEAAANSPELAAARAAVEQAAYSRRADYGAYLPQLSADASAARRGSRATDDEPRVTADNSSVGVSARQTLYAGGKNRAAVEQSSASLDAAEASLSSAEAELTYAVREAFAGLLYVQQQIELNRAIVERRGENVELINLRYESGRENQGSLLRMKAQWKDAEAELAQAVRRLGVARRQLASALGRDEADAFSVTGAWEAAVSPKPASFAELLPVTPERRQALAEVRAARAAVRSARSGHRPEIAAGASYAQTGEDWMPEGDEWYVGLTLSYPFFSGGRSYMDVRAAKAGVKEAEAGLDATDASLLASFEEVYAGCVDAAEQVEVQAAYLEAAEVRAEIARSEYAAGLMSFDEWDRIENELISSRKQYLSVRRDAVVAVAQWEQVQGLSRLPERGDDR